MLALPRETAFPEAPSHRHGGDRSKPLFREPTASFHTGIATAQSMEEYQRSIVGEQVIELAEQALGQIKFVPIVALYAPVTLLDGRAIEIGVLAEDHNLPAFDEPRRKP